MPSAPPVMNRALRGIFCGKHIRFGNNVSHSYQHTRRSWKPNVHQKRLESAVLDHNVRLHLTTSAMRTIEKVGGLDAFLVSSKYVEESIVAKALRKRVLEKLEASPAIPRPVVNVRLPKPPRSLLKQG